MEDDLRTMAGRSSSAFYPRHARSYRSRHSERVRHASSRTAGVNAAASCLDVLRWAVSRRKRRLFYRTIILVAIIPMVVTLFLLKPAGLVLQEELEHVITIHGANDNTSIPTTNNSWRFLKHATASHPRGNNVNAAHTVTVTPHTNSNFAHKYANHYAENDTEFFVQLRDIMDRKWRENVTSIKEFRNDLRAALGDNGRLDKFIVTKQNTKAGEKINFLYSGGSTRISSVLWKTLPSDTLYRAGLYNRCCVVGSSGILNGSRCGKSIDSADFVFRFNLADIKNYEVDVGSKTNFTTLNPSLLYAKLNSLKKKGDQARFADMLKQFRGSHLWLPAFAFRWNYYILARAAGIARSSKHVQPIYGHPRHYNAVAQLWHETLNGTQRTTTGLHVISSIFDMCDRVDVYGFWPFKTSLEGATVPYHYHDQINGTSAHSFSKEFKGLVALHNRGIIQLHVDPCLPVLDT